MVAVEKPVPPTVTATNSNPIKVAAAPPAKMKKLSQLCGIGDRFALNKLEQEEDKPGCQSGPLECWSRQSQARVLERARFARKNLLKPPKYGRYYARYLALWANAVRESNARDWSGAPFPAWYKLFHEEPRQKRASFCARRYVSQAVEASIHDSRHVRVQSGTPAPRDSCRG